MNKRGEYSVRISGLKDGGHEFGFDIGNSFFKSLDHPDISGGSIRAIVKLDKKPGILTMAFHLKGKVDIICDRCLDYYAQDIKVNETVYVKFGEDQDEENENIIWIRQEEHEIIIDQLLMEFIILGLPMKKIHPDAKNGEPGCNREMMAKLNEHIVREKNKNSDPRWDDLKRLIENKN